MLAELYILYLCYYNNYSFIPPILQESLKLVQPTAKREGFATIPDVTWDDVGALEDVREELSLAILVIYTIFGRGGV